MKMRWEALAVKVTLWYMGFAALAILILWVASIFWMKGTVQ